LVLHKPEHRSVRLVNVIYFSLHAVPTQTDRMI
jgi:hypothetical protein